MIRAGESEDVIFGGGKCEGRGMRGEEKEGEGKRIKTETGG